MINIDWKKELPVSSTMRPATLADLDGMAVKAFARSFYPGDIISFPPLEMMSFMWDSFKTPEGVQKDYVKVKLAVNGKLSYYSIASFTRVPNDPEWLGDERRRFNRELVNCGDYRNLMEFLAGKSIKCVSLDDGQIAKSFTVDENGKSHPVRDADGKVISITKKFCVFALNE